MPARASAKSIRIPFGRLRYVGGKSENIPKKIVCPAALAPSTDTLKTLSVLAPDTVGLNSKDSFFQDEETPLRDLVAYTWPEDEETSETVILPVKLADLA